MSALEREWEPDPWEEQAAERWERAEERERAEEARWDRLNRDVGTARAALEEPKP